MSGYAGYLFVFDSSERSQMMLKRIKTDRRFSQSVSVPDSKVGKAELCLLSADKKAFSAICLLIRGNMTATLEYHVEITGIFQFDPLPMDAFDDSKGTLKNLASKTTFGLTERLSDSQWTHIVARLGQHSPEIGAAIQRLDQQRRLLGEEYGSEGFMVAAEEKDAVGMAVEIFGMDKHKKIPSIFPADTKKNPIPFLEAVQNVKVREDLMIAHDAKLFPGWEQFQHYQHGMVEFRKRNGERLVVCNVNRQKLESTLGVDLIYYNHTYASFVMVQYKRMREETPGKFCYRPDENYALEIGRMREFRKQIAKLASTAEIDGYRLNSEMFYFKLCREVIFTPASNDWIEGMYVPLDYWDILEPQASGSRGGTRFDADTLFRWFSNTFFAELVQKGWIGCKTNAFETVSKLIADSLQNRRSVVIAKEMG